MHKQVRRSLWLAFSLAAACSSDDSGSGVDADASTAEVVAAAKVTGPITGTPFTATALALSEHGYQEREYFIEGDATAYGLKGAMGLDGQWDVEETTHEPVKTRVLVRRPKKAADFNGVVIVEWLNVSGGVDADPGFMFNWEEILRGGYAWVGVSAQSAGVEGGGFALPRPEGAPPVLPLKEWDAMRYGSLVHPGDDYSYDIFTQTADVVLHPGKVDVLDGLRVKHVLAYGESQSAQRLVTYVNAVQPLARLYDGVFIHSRAVGAAPVSGDAGIPGLGNKDPARIREDLDVPVFQLMTETDVVGLLGNFAPSRQPDSAKLRTWEVAGTAHADKHLIDFQEMGGDLGCSHVNDGPQHFVLKAALHALREWVEDGTKPPSAKPLRLNGEQDGLATDELGNTLDGVRTPAVDVPTAVLSGKSMSTSIVCSLFGQTTPLSPAQLAELYPTHQDYLDKVTASAAAARKAGFILAEEEATIVQTAKQAAIPK